MLDVYDISNIDINPTYVKEEVVEHKISFYFQNYRRIEIYAGINVIRKVARTANIDTIQYILDFLSVFIFSSELTAAGILILTLPIKKMTGHTHTYISSL